MFEVSAVKAGAGAIAAMEPTGITPRQKSRKGGKSRCISKTRAVETSRDIPQAIRRSKTKDMKPAEHNSAGQRKRDNQVSSADRNLLSGQRDDANQSPVAAQTESPGQIGRATQFGSARRPDTDCGQNGTDSHVPIAAVGEIVAVYRRYEDLRRARQRIELQAIATCRNACGGDKTEGMKLYKSPTPQVAVWLTPYEDAMAPLTEAIKGQEKLLTKLAKTLPVIEWANGVSGLSPRFLAAIVGECGIGPGEFRSVSALWKRMGMAVIGGERQRRVTGAAAIEHGYVARRRALMWNIGDQVAVRHGVRNPKDADGKSTGATAANEWGELYLERKAYELAREIDGKPLSPMHSHNRAKRYVEKRLLRELWKAWRKSS